MGILLVILGTAHRYHTLIIYRRADSYINPVIYDNKYISKKGN